LRRRRLPGTQDAAVAALPRAQGLAATVVLIAILRHGPTQARMERLAQVVRVDRRTIARWRAWWREVFTATQFWAAAGAAFLPPIDEAQLPGALIERFSGDVQDRLIALLRFLGPITGGVRMRAF
jgi:hypothetical protein